MQLAAFQGSQARLCVPFAAFHAAADSVPGFDGIMTLGLALMAPTIATEAASRCEAPEVEATVARAKEMLAERARRAEARDE